MTEQQIKDFKIINGNSLEVLNTIPENSIDAIITDPPYGLTTITKRFGKENSAPCKQGKDGSFARLSKGFMGKEWDGSGIEYNVELWKKALKVLKPGGHLLAFGGTRTFHRIACAIEDAGFEIRDCIMWLYGSGFPKSHNVGLDIDKLNGCENRGHRIAVANRHHPDGTLEPNGEKLEPYKAKTEQGQKWNGWGTALKPAYEPIIMARKPISESSVAKNVLKHGVGGINIDECRVPFEKTTNPATNPLYRKKQIINCQKKGQKSNGSVNFTSSKNETNDLGRFPANTIITYNEKNFDEVCGGMPNSKSTKTQENDYRKNVGNSMFINGVHNEFNSYNDEGSASRYFYCAKASKKDRDDGLAFFEIKEIGDGCVRSNPETSNKFGSGQRFGKNIHPTVKPIELMQYLVRLVSPKGATILDIFNGSGSTGKAVAFENRERDANYKYIGIELDPEYCEISKSRIDYALNKFEYDIVEEIKENKEKGQISLFDFTW